MIKFNYIVFDMFQTSKCSSSGRLVHAVLWCFSCVRISSLVDVRMCLSIKTIKLYVQLFLRMNTCLFATCRRQC